MNPSSVTAPESKASEAIVSTDGRIQRRIPNYETVILNITDSHKSAANLKAVNDDYAEIPVLLDSVVIDPENPAPARRFSVTVLGFMVLLTFLWSAYSLFFLQKERQIAGDTSQLESNTTPAYETNHLLQINKLSDLILQDNSWHDSRVKSILQHWNQLDASERENARHNPWFQHFTYSLNKHVKRHSAVAATAEQSIESSPLMKLANALGVTVTKGAPVTKSNSNPNYQKLVAEIKNDITQVEHSAKSARQTAESDVKLNALFKREFAAMNEASETTVANPVTKEIVKALLVKYQDAYESGNLSAMTEIFGMSHLKNSDNSLISNFGNIFKNTAKRNIHFHDFTWESTTKNVIINSKYSAKLEFTNNKGTQNVQAQAKIVAVLKSNRLQVASFELLDSKVSVTTPKLEIPPENTPVEKPELSTAKIPNAAQLQDLTAKFITAYEAGDIEQFTALFSGDVKSNERLDREGLRDDYTQLFKTTSERQMFIMNLKWIDESIGAKGTGDLEAAVFSNNNSSVYSMKGKIQIVVQLINDKPLITHLYHIEHQK